MYLCVFCVCVYTHTFVSVCHVYRGIHRRQKRALNPQGAGVSGSCKLFDMDAGSWTQGQEQEALNH